MKKKDAQKFSFFEAEILFQNETDPENDEDADPEVQRMSIERKLFSNLRQALRIITEPFLYLHPTTLDLNLIKQNHMHHLLI